MKKLRVVLRYIFLNAVIIAVVCLALHVFRCYFMTVTPGTPGKLEVFFSWSGVWSSIANIPGIIAIVVGCALGFSTHKTLGLIKDVSGDLRDATDELVLQARNTIPEFQDVLEKAANMLKSVHDNSNSLVNVAVFWPMFGADLGEEFQRSDGKVKEKDFYDERENPFYYYLAKRIKHNMHTKLVFLEFSGSEGEDSKLTVFIDVLSRYPKPKGQAKENNFSSEGAKHLKGLVVKHIKEGLVGKSKSHECLGIKVAENIPVLLFTSTEDKKKSSGIQREGLLFIDNVDMMRKPSPHGGFYTQKPEMIDIMDGLFESVFVNARRI
ncbi:MAG: hypothetical protein KAV87_50990 [Desulfobacteraceae bacterium]|nr:hypothetical protein [Desulfobacteraceae bacterium]